LRYYFKESNKKISETIIVRLIVSTGYYIDSIVFKNKKKNCIKVSTFKKIVKNNISTNVIK